MKLVIQRVSQAKLSVKNNLISEIGQGLFILVGVGVEDTDKNAEFLASKLAKLRVMKDSTDKMNLTVKDVGGELLVVSQFTLYADTSGGNRPSFIKAAEPSKARSIYEYFIKKLREYDLTVKTGVFGEYMKIEPILDGPVTIVMESNSLISKR